MKRLLFVLFSVAVAVIGIGLASAIHDKALNGIVEYSFDHNFRILRTADAIYLFKSSLLDHDQFSLLSQVGRNIEVSVSLRSIASVWAISSEPEGERLAASKSYVKPKGRSIGIAGNSLYSPTQDFVFLEVNGTIFRLKKDSLPPDLQKQFRKSNFIVGEIPTDSIDFAWKTTTTTESTVAPTSRTPAALGQSLGGGNLLKISGMTHLSFDDRALIIESSGLFFLISQQSVPERLLPSLREPGKEIKIQLPMDKIIMVWSQENAELPPALLHSIVPPY